MGAPRGNLNAVKHGTYSFLTTGSLPKGGSYIRKLIGQLKRQLEASVLEAHGEISLPHAARIQSVVRHEARCLLLARYVRQDGLELDTRLKVLKELTDSTERRDKAVRDLALDRRDGFDASTLYQNDHERGGAQLGGANHDPS